MRASDTCNITYIYDDIDDVNDESNVVDCIAIGRYMWAMATRKIITFDDGLLRRIDDFRFAKRIRSEAEAIRRLIEIGLAQEQQAAGEIEGIDIEKLASKRQRQSE